MRKESAIIRKCSAQRTESRFYASIQHILSNVMNAGILRSGRNEVEVFPELQIDFFGTI